jgi:hypothetical protein
MGKINLDSELARPNFVGHFRQHLLPRWPHNEPSFRYAPFLHLPYTIYIEGQWYQTAIYTENDNCDSTDYFVDMSYTECHEKSHQ